jgi:hypothetical protein
VKRAAMAFVVLLAGMVGLASPARATQPTVQAFHTEGNDLELEDCGDFKVILDFSHDETITTFYDRFGSPLSSQTVFSFQATLTNSVTGKTAYEKGRYTIFVDLRTEEVRQAGLVLLITVPGQGVALLELGHVSFDALGNASLAGSPLITQGDSFFCALLR